MNDEENDDGCHIFFFFKYPVLKVENRGNSDEPLIMEDEW